MDHSHTKYLGKPLICERCAKDLTRVLCPICEANKEKFYAKVLANVGEEVLARFEKMAKAATKKP